MIWGLIRRPRVLGTQRSILFFLTPNPALMARTWSSIFFLSTSCLCVDLLGKFQRSYAGSFILLSWFSSFLAIFLKWSHVRVSLLAFHSLHLMSPRQGFVGMDIIFFKGFLWSGVIPVQVHVLIAFSRSRFCQFWPCFNGVDSYARNVIHLVYRTLVSLVSFSAFFFATISRNSRQ